MLKLRLKRTGRKGSPSYRLVIMENSTRRNGRPIEEVGHYNPISKKSFFDVEKIKKWLRYGVKPTQTVLYLLRKVNINTSIEFVKLTKGDFNDEANLTNISN